MNNGHSSSGKKTIWISYDLGIRGDYTGLYTWLDKYGARECGDSMAVVIWKTIKGDVPATLAQELKKNVQLTKTDRIYIIYRDEEKVKGKFIFGGRKRAPWEGYRQVAGQAEEDE